MAKLKLLTRTEFRNNVFIRDMNVCVVPDCGKIAVDAHHLMERRLWDNEGYYLDNGASLCEEHHRLAERDIILPRTLRAYCNIMNIVLPKYFDINNEYTKWGVILKRKTTKNIKFPSMLYLPFSPTIAGDVGNLKMLLGCPCVITKKMDGSNVKLTREKVAARNGQSADHKSFDYLKAYHKTIAHNIPEHLIIFGEWLYAEHSIYYNNLDNYLQLFAIYNIKTHMWSSWLEVRQMAHILGVVTVPCIEYITYEKEYEMIKDITKIGNDIIKNGHEGLVIRNIFPFHNAFFIENIMKYVRLNHVQTNKHWSNKPIVKNILISN